jgi:hypothetical protein
MSLIAEYKKSRQTKELIPIREGIKLHERALAGLESQLKTLEAAYNKRGYELTQAKRAEMGLNDDESKFAHYGESNERLPMMDMVILDGDDREFKRLYEDMNFTKGEIVRISQKLDALRNYLKTQEA